MTIGYVYTPHLAYLMPYRLTITVCRDPPRLLQHSSRPSPVSASPITFDLYEARAQALTPGLFSKAASDTMSMIAPCALQTSIEIKAHASKYVEHGNVNKLDHSSHFAPWLPRSDGRTSPSKIVLLHLLNLVGKAT